MCVCKPSFNEDGMLSSFMRVIYVHTYINTCIHTYIYSWCERNVQILRPCGNIFIHKTMQYFEHLNKNVIEKSLEESFELLFVWKKTRDACSLNRTRNACSLVSTFLQQVTNIMHCLRSRSRSRWRSDVTPPLAQGYTSWNHHGHGHGHGIFILAPVHIYSIVLICV